MPSVFQNCFLRIFSFGGGGPDGPDPGGPVDPDDCTGQDPICCEQNPDAIGCDGGDGDSDPCDDLVQITTCGDECDSTGCCGGNKTTSTLSRGELRSRCQLDNGQSPSCDLPLPNCLTCDGGVKYSVGNACLTQCCPSDQCLYIECTASQGVGCDKGPPDGCCAESTEAVEFVPEGDPCPDASDVDNPNGLSLYNTLVECVEDECILEGTCTYYRCPGGSTNGTACTATGVDLTALNITDCEDKPATYIDPNTGQTYYSTKAACEGAGEPPCCIVTYYKCDTDSEDTVCGTCNQYSVNDGTCDIPAGDDIYADSSECDAACPGTQKVYQCNNPSKGFCDTVPDFCVEDDPGGNGTSYFLESGTCNKQCCEPIEYWYCPAGVEGGECTNYFDDDCIPDSGNSGPNGELVFNSKSACEKSQNTYCCEPEPTEDNYTNVNCEGNDGNCSPTGECLTPDNVGIVFSNPTECNASVPNCCNAYDNPDPLITYINGLLAPLVSNVRPLFYCEGQLTTPFKIELTNDLPPELKQFGYSKLSDFSFPINGQQPAVVNPAGSELIRWDFDIPTSNPSVAYFVFLSDCDSTLISTSISFSLNNCLDTVNNYNNCNNLTNGNVAPYSGQFPCAAGSICDTPLGTQVSICDPDVDPIDATGVTGIYESKLCPSYQCVDNDCVQIPNGSIINVFQGDTCEYYYGDEIGPNTFIGECGFNDKCTGGGVVVDATGFDGAGLGSAGGSNFGTENRLGATRTEQVSLDYLQNLNRVYESDKLFDVAASNKKFFNRDRRFMPLRNSKQLDIFANVVHASVWAILNTTPEQSYIYERSFDDISLDYLERSLNPQLQKRIANLKDYEGSPLKKKILSRIRRLLISDRLDEFDLTGIEDIDADHDTYVRSSSISNENKLINLINEKAKPLNPEVYGGITKERVGLWKTVAPDLQKAIGVVDKDSTLNFIDINVDDSYEVYFADGTSFTSYIKEGDIISYIDTNGNKSYLDLDTLIDRAVMLDFEDARQAFAYINEDYATTLEVESNEEALVEETYDLSAPRESFYFLKIHPETIQDADRTNPLVRITTATFELLTDENEINDWIEFKPWPYLHYYMDSSDPFFDHLQNANQLSATFKDISFDKFVGYSDDIPVTPRRIPWYIVIVPTDRTRYLIGSGRSLLTGYNSRKAIFRLSPSKKDVKQRWNSEIYDEKETEFYEGVDPRVQKNSVKVEFNKDKIKMAKVLYKNGAEKLPRKPSAARVLFNALKEVKDEGASYVDEKGETVAWASVYKKLTPFQRKEISSDIQNFKSVKDKIGTNTFAKTDAVKERFPKVSDVLDQKLTNVTEYEKPVIKTRARRVDIDPEAATPELLP